MHVLIKSYDGNIWISLVQVRWFRARSMMERARRIKAKKLNRIMNLNFQEVQNFYRLVQEEVEQSLGHLRSVLLVETTAEVCGIVKIGC